MYIIKSNATINQQFKQHNNKTTKQTRKYKQREKMKNTAKQNKAK